MMMDLGHMLTDEALSQLERRISGIYDTAYKDLDKKVHDYFAAFEKRDTEQLELLRDEKITQKQYMQWRLAQIGRGKRFEALRDQMAERMTKANETSIDYVNRAVPGVYAINRNYAAYTIEQVAGNVDFTLWDEPTVRRLLKDAPDLMPYYPPERAVKRGIDLAYGKRQITALTTQGILQGEGVGKIADRLQVGITDMNRTSAIRAARTAVTGAESAGRVDTYSAAAGKGVKIKKQWLATLDARTRHSHVMLDGEGVGNDEKFSNGCRFPGDPSGPPNEIYNCRCTLIADLADFSYRNAKRRVGGDVGEDMTYREWCERKKGLTNSVHAAGGFFMPKNKGGDAD